MTSIILTVSGAKAFASVSGPLTSGMVGIPVTIQYDDAWDGLTKNLVCRCGQWGPDRGETRTVLSVGESATVAHEVMKADTRLYLGVEGYSAGGELVIPTTWADCGLIQHGANADADPSADSKLSVWAQLRAEIEHIRQNPVAIEQIEAAVAAYLEENPISGSDPSQNVDLTGYATERYVQEFAQPRGDYLTEHQDISGKLDADKLPEAVNDALAQAKASGAFDGTDGQDGAPGADGKDGADYVLTDADKAEIAEMVIESLGGNPVFGYVDSANNIVVQGNLADGSYTVKYEMEDGSTVNIGNLVLDSNVYYSVTNNLTDCVSSNSATQVAEGESYSATITAKSGYELKSVTVNMGGNAVTAANGVISIANVTGNIVITAAAAEIVAKYTNLADPTSSDWLENTRISSSGFPAQSGITTSNWIPVTKGDVVRIRGIDVNTNQYARVALFNSSKGLLSSAKVSGITSADATGVTYDTTGAQFTIASTNAKYIRICGELNGTSADVIITVNEEIL